LNIGQGRQHGFTFLGKSLPFFVGVKASGGGSFSRPTIFRAMHRLKVDFQRQSFLMLSVNF
jgi:hypothetical protein